MKKIPEREVKRKIARLYRRGAKKLAVAKESAKKRAIKQVTPESKFMKWLWEAWLNIEKFLRNKKYN